MDNDKDISTLNSLIKTTLDSVKGYEDAAEASEGRFTTPFRELGRDRQQVVAHLQEEVRRLGGEPENDGSVMGAAHRAFLNLKQSVTSSDEKAIVDEVERGEDHLKEKYEEVLRDRDLSPQARSVVEQACASVREGHDRASALKHSMAI